MFFPDMHVEVVRGKHTVVCNLKCVRKKYDRFMGGQRGDRQIDEYRIKYYLNKKIHRLPCRSSN